MGETHAQCSALPPARSPARHGTHTHTHRVKVVRPLLPSFLPSLLLSLSPSFLPSLTRCSLAACPPACLQPSPGGTATGRGLSLTSPPHQTPPQLHSAPAPLHQHAPGRQASSWMDGWMDALTPSIYYYTLPCTIFTYSVLLLLLLQVRIALFDLGNMTIKLS